MTLEVFRLSDDETELAMIRRKKMAAMIAREKQEQQQREKAEKVGAEREKILKRFLASDAMAYFEKMRTTEPAVAKRIEDIVLSLVVYRGIRQQFSQIDIMYIERQIKGEGPKIRVQRDGETSDFGAYVRDAIRDTKDKENEEG